MSTACFFSVITYLAALLLFFGAGCATLPDVPTFAGQKPTGEPPKIRSARGLLSRKESKAIMSRLKAQVNPTDLLERHEAVLEMVSGSQLTKGNKVTLLIDGDATYKAMFAAIEHATQSINLETFKIDDDQTGRSFAELLLKKQSQGVQVNILYDSMGSFATSSSFFDALREAGAEVVAHLSWLSTHADHRKLLIVDGKVVITGGLNISKVYASTPFKRDEKKKGELPWRDTDIELEGPVAADFQKIFVETWVEEDGPPLSGARYFPKLENKGSALVRAIGSTPGEPNRLGYISYVSALRFAQHSIYLTNAYFIPDDRTLDALTDAAKRGVDVKIILPSVTDSNLALYAMRHNFTDLLKSGVKLYIRHKALLHSKTAVIDGVWSTVGSSNMDYLSLSNNYEVDAVILGREFAKEMDMMFVRDLAESEPVILEQWKKRPFSQRVRELFSHLLSHLM